MSLTQWHGSGGIPVEGDSSGAEGRYFQVHPLSSCSGMIYIICVELKT